MKKKYKVLLIMPVAFLLALVVLCLFLPSIRYHLALRQIETGAYTKAYKNLLGCRGYRDSTVLLGKFTLQYGTLWTEKTYHKEGLNGKHQTLYTYDARGNVLMEKIFNIKGEVSEEIRGEFQYDEADRLILENYQDKEGQKGRYEYGYDVAGKLIFRQTINGDTQQKQYYTYDDAGNLTQVEIYDLKGNLLSASQRRYDAQGSVIREDCYNDKGLTGTTVWEYAYAVDDADRQTMVARYDAKGNLDHRIEYIYDRQGNKIKEIYYGADGRVSYTTTWEYDSRGNLRKETEKDSAGRVYKETAWSRDRSTKTDAWYSYEIDGSLNETQTHTYTDPVAFYCP